jgi:hypothetical protein
MIAQIKEKVLKALSENDLNTAMNLLEEMISHLADEDLEPAFQEPYELIGRIHGALGDKGRTVHYFHKKLDVLEVYGYLGPRDRAADIRELLERFDI